MTESPIPLAEQLRRQSHRICAMILNSDCAQVDISIQIGRLRDEVSRRAPDKEELFEAVYVSRFNRLWRQWRDPEN